MDNLTNLGTTRGMLVESHIADLHFGAINPQTQYEILRDQYISLLYELPKLDIICVIGDIFDHKVMLNSAVTYYAQLFMSDLVNLARVKNASIILLHGTYSHDANQLRIFYPYLEDNTIEMHIVEDLSFVYTKGARILCIPELYGVDEQIYRNYLFGMGYYDLAIIHGTFEGSVYGNNVGNSRLFTMEDFSHCMGPILGGHVHKPGCFDKHFYYCGTPIRYKFGEEEAKGHLIVLHDLDSRRYMTKFMTIESFKYTTIEISDIISNDPNTIIQYIDNIQSSQNIDFIKVRFNIPIEGSIKSILENRYRNTNNTILEFINIQEKMKREQQQMVDDEYSFILSNQYTPEDKVCMYINKKENCEFITVDMLRELLKE